LHDVSWGTKGDNVVVKDDAPAKIKVDNSGKEIFVLNLPDTPEECSENWQSFINQLLINKTSGELPKSERSVSTKQEDSCKEFRTGVVLSWILSNSLLVTVNLIQIAIFTNSGTLSSLFPRKDGSVNPYLTFLFWSIAAISAIRFIGSVMYMFSYFADKRTDAAGITKTRADMVTV
jgi:chitin synthase